MSVNDLVAAAQNGNIDEVTRLLNSGVPVNERNSGGSIALGLASSGGHEAVVRLLLSRGANVNMTNSSGATALTEASYKGHPSIAELLLRSGADHALQFKDGRTALHWACEYGRVQVAELLLRHGASNTCRNKAGKIPIELCKDSSKRSQIQAVINSLATQPPPAPTPAPTPVSAPAPAPVPTPAPTPPVAALEQLRAQVASLTSERDSLQREKDGLTTQVAQLTTERNTAVGDRNAINTQLTARTTELDARTRERDSAVADRDAAVADRTVLMADVIERTRERDTARAERDAARAERDQLRAQGPVGATASADLCPFVRYQPHVYAPGVLPAHVNMNTPGLVELPATSSLFTFARQLTLTGGNWCFGAQREVAGFRLAKVHAIVPPAYLVGEYTNRQARMNALRATGGAHFNQSDLNVEQLRVLNTLRAMFHERAPGPASTDRSVNTVYCYHGPRRENLESICSNGMVAVGGMDAGFFGVGCYTTLNIEYAAKYAHGDFDTDASGFPTGPRASEDGLYPVIMFAATVGMAYPITREADYTPGEQRSQLFGRPFKRGFDAHVACVNQMMGYQAVSRDQCEYVELVFEQQAQLLPVAVLWFEK